MTTVSSDITMDKKSLPREGIASQGHIQTSFMLTLLNTIIKTTKCTYNFSTIGPSIPGQVIVRIPIRVVLGDDEWWISVKVRDAEDLQYVRMPQDLPFVNTVKQSLQFAPILHVCGHVKE